MSTQPEHSCIMTRLPVAYGALRLVRYLGRSFPGRKLVLPGTARRLQPDRTWIHGISTRVGIHVRRSALITGSNMTGKTTYMKTAGVNIVLGPHTRILPGEERDPASVSCHGVRSQ